MAIAERVVSSFESLFWTRVQQKLRSPPETASSRRRVCANETGVDLFWELLEGETRICLAVEYCAP